MDVIDRRVKRTQNLLAKALIALTLEKGYDAITIRDLTERAEVGYATFFRHYHDKDELLKDVIDVVLEELLALLLPPMQEADPITIGTLIFRYVQEHNEVIRVLVSSRSSSSPMQHAIQASVGSVLARHRPLEGSPIPMEIAAYHLVTSSIALIQWWLDHDMPYPPERMGIIYYALISGPTTTVAFKK